MTLACSGDGGDGVTCLRAGQPVLLEPWVVLRPRLANFPNFVSAQTSVRNPISGTCEEEVNARQLAR